MKGVLAQYAQKKRDKERKRGLFVALSQRKGGKSSEAGAGNGRFAWLEAPVIAPPQRNLHGNPTVSMAMRPFYSTKHRLNQAQTRMLFLFDELRKSRRTGQKPQGGNVRGQLSLLWQNIISNLRLKWLDISPVNLLPHFDAWLSAP